MKRNLFIIFTAIAVIGIMFLALYLLDSYRPKRWSHATIQEVNAYGQTSHQWEDVQIERVGNSWVRFTTRDGQQIVIDTPHRLLYSAEH
jgi:alpha-glucuronidase